jgi:nucleoside-diphosphate-sugar epimerase
MILVTGGAGAMGLRLVRRLREREIPVRVIGLANDRAAGRVEAMGAEYRGVDILDGRAIRESVSGIEGVVHLAARILSRRDPAMLHRINVEGTRNVVEAARRSGAGRFLHISSISVTYANQNGYSRSKARGESVVRESGLDWTILRPTLAWGDPSAVEYATFARLAGTFPILPLPGGGRALKSPVHVDDLAVGFERALFSRGASGRTIALGGPESISLAAMARRIRSARGGGGFVLPVPARPAAWAILAHARIWRTLGLEPLADWQTWTGLVEDACPDTADAKTVLGWDPRPFDPSQDGLRPEGLR